MGCSVLTVLVEVKVFEELVKVGVEVVLHAHLEIVGQPQSVCIIHQTIIVHPHHLVLHMYMYMSIKRLTFAFAFSQQVVSFFRRHSIYVRCKVRICTILGFIHVQWLGY